MVASWHVCMCCVVASRHVCSFISCSWRRRPFSICRSARASGVECYSSISTTCNILVVVACSCSWWMEAKVHQHKPPGAACTSLPARAGCQQILHARTLSCSAASYRAHSSPAMNFWRKITVHGTLRCMVLHASFTSKLLDCSDVARLGWN